MNDELLDQVIARLRDEPVPEIPGELTHRPDLPSRRWKREAAIAGGLAASLLMTGWWIWSTEQRREAGAHVARGTVVVRTIDLAQPLTRLEAGLTTIDAEIVALRRRAALLDARRKADELAAHYRVGAAMN